MKSEIYVLVVAVKQEDREFYTHLFEDLECHASSTDNPQRAITLFLNYHKNKRPFDIVLMEYLLPGMNGISLAKRLKSLAPEVTLMLFPTPLLNDKSIRQDYDNFGGFAQNPRVDYKGLTSLIKIAQSRRPLP